MFSSFSLAKNGLMADRASEWQPNEEAIFSDPETNFQLVMKTLLEKHLDKNVNKEALYRAATKGMLQSLNTGGGAWNDLISPTEFKEMQMELSGKTMGIGVSLKFDENTGNALVMNTVKESAGEKAGIKEGDQILSVDGKKFKGKSFADMVFAIRGEAGKSVKLRVLRDDDILTFNIKREKIAWTSLAVEFQQINEQVGLLSIDLFNEETPKIVADKIAQLSKKNIGNLIIDLRSCTGGGFDQAVKTAELFIPKNAVIVKTKNRDGKMEEFVSTQGLLNPKTKVIILTSHETSSGAEFFTQALVENIKAKTVGETTLGKWNAQRLEVIPNKYAIKYTVKEFQSPSGKSFQGVGIKPDVEVSTPEKIDLTQLKRDLVKRLEQDPQLKAAIELIK